MKKYISFFQLKFKMGLQYRAAAIGGIVTQFFWGLMEIVVYHAFYRGNADAFPMGLSSIVCYVWLKEALLVLFYGWATDDHIFQLIMNGNVSYELCRPVNLYHMWFSYNIGDRVSKAMLRCIPILLFAFLLPKGYRMMLPKDLSSFLIFFISLILGVVVTVSISMLIYLLNFYTISPRGIQMMFTSMIEFLSGSLIPLPFFPNTLQRIVELLPFGSMQNVPFRIYSGDLAGKSMYQALAVQIFWVILLVFVGQKLCQKAVRKVTIQGG